MKKPSVCMRCENYDPTSPYQEPPPCLFLSCCGYDNGCTCETCKDHEAQQQAKLDSNHLTVIPDEAA